MIADIQFFEHIRYQRPAHTGGDDAQFCALPCPYPFSKNDVACARLKKREEKRLRRLQKKQGPDGEPHPEGAEPSLDEESSEAEESAVPEEPPQA